MGRGGGKASTFKAIGSTFFIQMKKKQRDKGKSQNGFFFCTARLALLFILSFCGAFFPYKLHYFALEKIVAFLCLLSNLCPYYNLCQLLVCLFAFIPSYINLCFCLCLFVSISLSICLSLSMCLFIYLHTYYYINLYRKKNIHLMYT